MSAQVLKPKFLVSYRLLHVYTNCDTNTAFQFRLRNSLGIVKTTEVGE